VPSHSRPRRSASPSAKAITAAGPVADDGYDNGAKGGLPGVLARGGRHCLPRPTQPSAASPEPDRPVVGPRLRDAGGIDAGGGPAAIPYNRRMIRLGVNIDHVATLRQARYRDAAPDAGEPDPVRAAAEAELGGADCITVHLREDRRHITDRDAELLRRLVRVKFNLEMAATKEMVEVARRLRPHMATLVPEGRTEVTTEGGLDVIRHEAGLKATVARLREAGITVSAFIDADPRQVEAAARLGFEVCEVHTGPYAAAYASCGGDITNADLMAALEQVAVVGAEVRGAGMRFNAGHALNYFNVVRVAALPGIAELHIGHAIVSRGVFTGLREAVRQMKELMVKAHARQEA
jgi:pyridoxine 5-phosphate synthase